MVERGGMRWEESGGGREGSKWVGRMGMAGVWRGEGGGGRGRGDAEKGMGELERRREERAIAEKEGIRSQCVAGEWVDK